MSDRELTPAQGRGPLGDLLRRMRRGQGLRPAQAAAALGVGLRTYGNFESGKTQPTPDRLRRFAALVDCDYAALLLAAGGLPQALVLASARNKAVTIAVGGIEDLYAAIPTAFATLTGAELVAAFDEAGRRLQAGAFETSRRRAGAAEDGAPVTPRQLECLRWAQAGKSSTDIGAILGISARTVDYHLGQACARLAVRTRVQAISLAIDAGLLSPRPS